MYELLVRPATDAEHEKLNSDKRGGEGNFSDSAPYMAFLIITEPFRWVMRISENPKIELLSVSRLGSGWAQGSPSRNPQMDPRKPELRRLWAAPQFADRVWRIGIVEGSA